MGLILLILLISCWFSKAGGGFALAPLWLWAPSGADFVHFACFLLVLGGWWGLRPRPLCGCGPLVGLIAAKRLYS